MHALILGVAAALIACAGTARAQTAPDTASCAPAHAAVIERFITAECSGCWTDASTPAATAGGWLLDWIVPSARGDDAPLSPAAPDEAAGRARRALKGEVADGRTTVHRSAARRAASARLTVVSGPAFNGYLGVQIDGRGSAPPGSSLWAALVESVPAGTDGTPVPRQLVRTVAGPFQPSELRSGQAWRVLQAMRWPETAKPQRLLARAWIERADGRVLVMAGERCAK